MMTAGMDRIFEGCGFSLRHFQGLGLRYCLLFLMAMGAFASCHRPHTKRNHLGAGTPLSPDDSLLGVQFPMRDYFQDQKDLLLKHSKPTKRVIVADGEILAGIFNSGAIDLILDEIASEPQYFHGHLEADSPEVQLALMVYHIPNKELDRLVAGQKYRVHWVETVVNMQPLDDDRFRRFVAYRIEEL
ncbi:MAG: hypothetical protein IPP17_24695 [Bacteroidetes bacterium]|nr:hypothetical protein [Bacteroidota bacterium]